MQPQKTWINHLTHTLTHNGLDFSGQCITKQHPAALKPKKLRNFKTFFKPSELIICVHISGFSKRNELPMEAPLGLLLWAVCVPEGV